MKKKKMVGATRFELATSCSQSKCSSQAELRSDNGDHHPMNFAGRNEIHNEIRLDDPRAHC